MKIVFLLLLLAGAGCRTYVYTHVTPEGDKHEVYISTLITDAKIEKLRLTLGTNVVLDLTGYSGSVNTEAMSAVAEGMTKAMIKSAVVP